MGDQKVRISVTLPPEVVREIDGVESNRSRFVLQAVERELERRRRAGLVESLDHPHPESIEVAEAGIEDWFDRAAPGDTDLVVKDGGRAIRWSAERGWESEPD